MPSFFAAFRCPRERMAKRRLSPQVPKRHRLPRAKLIRRGTKKTRQPPIPAIFSGCNPTRKHPVGAVDRGSTRRHLDSEGFPFAIPSFLPSSLPLFLRSILFVFLSLLLNTSVVGLFARLPSAAPTWCVSLPTVTIAS